MITKRKRKTKNSIIAKLLRLRTSKLARMQDIVGCRVTVLGGYQLAKKIETKLLDAFAQQKIQVQSKRRDNKGYRAVHLIATHDKKNYEIQLRTFAQDAWANLVEGLSDDTNSLKYGGRPEEQSTNIKLKRLSDAFWAIDQQAHTITVDEYYTKIKKEIENVLSH